MYANTNTFLMIALVTLEVQQRRITNVHDVLLTMNGCVARLIPETMINTTSANRAQPFMVRRLANSLQVTRPANSVTTIRCAVLVHKHLLLVRRHFPLEAHTELEVRLSEN